MILPTLYKPTKTGATQVCKISHNEDQFTVEFGQLNGKMQTKTTTCIGKNLGKTNETTPTEQAALEAQAKWVKKTKSGYVLNETGTLDNGEASVKLPMKVKIYGDHKNKVDFEGNVYVSPKLDGVNSEFRLNRIFQLLSRGGEEYPIIQNRDAQTLQIMERYDISSVNGEFYLHGHYLQDITSAIRKPGTDKLDLIFYAFDLPDEPGDYDDRLEKLRSLPFTQVPVFIVHSHEEIESFHKQFLAEGYEGTIIRNGSGLYEYNTRSNDVFKLKTAQDAEFLIDHYELDKNGQPVFLCHTEEGKPFKVKPKGTAVERLAIVENISDYLDHWYKIEFETYSKDKIPLKPVGIGLRNCDSEGNPLE